MPTLPNNRTSIYAEFGPPPDKPDTLAEITGRREAEKMFEALDDEWDAYDGGVQGGGSHEWTDSEGNTHRTAGIPLGLSKVGPRKTLGGTLTVGQFEVASPRQNLEAALSMPLSPFSTLAGQAREDALKSYGLGTVIRDFTIPEGRTEGDDLTLDDVVGAHPATRTYDLARRAAQWFVNDPDSPALSEDAYKSSAWFREGVPWDKAMTEQRARALAESFDRSKVREFYSEKRPITAFIGSLAGQAVDPINYIPVAGPLVKAAVVAKLGRVGGAAVHSAVDAAANTAIFGLATAGQRRRYGDDVSWQTTVSQIATAALIGSAFGTIGGALEARRAPTSRQAIEERLSTLKATQEARVALNEGIDALVHGEDLKLSPNATGPIFAAAGKITREMPSPEPVAVAKAATLDDVAVSLRKVETENPDLDPKASPSEFDRLLIEDLQKRGFDGIKDEADAPPMPLHFDPADIDVPRVEKNPTVRAVQSAMKPDSPEYARLQVEEATKANERLEREIQIGSRMHNRLLRWADERVIPGIALGKFDGLGIAPRMVELNRESIARYQAVARQEPAPDGIRIAEQRVGQPEDTRSLAEQHKVDMETGRFDEEADIVQLAKEGRLTEEDRAVLADAQVAFDDAVAYGEVLKSVAACLA